MNKKLNLITILLVAFLFMLDIVVAPDITPTVTAGSEQTFSGGSNIITVTISAQGNVTGVVLYYRAVSTDSWTNVGFNGTANLTTYTIDFSASRADSATAQLNATTRNYTVASTVGNLSSALVAINIDNSAPTDLSYYIPYVTTGNKNIPFKCNANDLNPNGNMSINIALNGPRGLIVNQSKSLLSLEDTLTFLDGFGTYTTTCDAIDGQGNRTRSSIISVKYASDDIEEELSQVQGVQDWFNQRVSLNKSVLIGTFVLVILGLLFMIIYFGRKK